ncbi:thymidylate synthase [Cyclospora cayetanensis]|uniref:Thymidylate synthase n=1 Tax=Cyclospora cayetanensis TaxID=88456 RepID=A0A1D3D363_9EIME|nr:thymidylate synthase [Cyclospora cayetanensis]
MADRRLPGRVYLWFPPDFHDREGTGFPSNLLDEGFSVVQINMCIAEAVDELSRREAAYLGQHESQQRVGSDVERNSKPYVAASLVHEAGETSIRDVKLTQQVAGRQRHQVKSCSSDTLEAHDACKAGICGQGSSLQRDMRRRLALQ